MRVKFIGTESERVIASEDLGMDPGKAWSWVPNGVIDLSADGVPDDVIVDLVENHPGQFEIVDENDQPVVGQIEGVTPSVQVTTSQPAQTDKQTPVTESSTDASTEASASESAGAATSGGTADNQLAWDDTRS